MLAKLLNHIQAKEVEQAISLVESNPEVLDQQDENGNSGFQLIAYYGIESLLTTATKVKPRLSFHESIIAGQIQEVKRRLEGAGDSLSTSFSTDGFSAISLAAYFNKDDIAKLLLSYGADPNVHATNASKVNALHAAVAKGNVELCRLFLENGAAVDATQTQGVTALHSAVHRGNMDIVKLLVQKGASIEVQMTNGDTPLVIAEREGHNEILAYLSGL